MTLIKWCFRQARGLKLVKPNDNLAAAYLKKADEALAVMVNEKRNSLTWSVSAAYYAMYNALYAVMRKIGVKCEMHSCSLSLLKIYLRKSYSSEEIELVELAFGLRNDLQYYVDKTIDIEDVKSVYNQAPLFVAKSKQITSELNEEQINEIRKRLKDLLGAQ